MKNLLSSIFCIFVITTPLFSQIITIPDAAFKNALIHSACTDTNGDGIIDGDADSNDDGEIELSEAIAVYKLYLVNKNIQDLTGIRQFSNLQHLDCRFNQLIELNVQNLANLHYLICSNNQLETLIIAGAANLEYLDCNLNHLSVINVQGFLNLKTFICTDNYFQNLSIQNLGNLKRLECSDNNLQILNAQNLVNLEILYCNFSRIQTLNIQGDIHLKELSCNNNQLSSLNLQGLTNLEILLCHSNYIYPLNVGNLLNLKTLDCRSNQTTFLDVQGLTNLQNLNCASNNLSTLNLQGLTNLQNLECNNNQLSTLNIQNLLNLQSVICSFNRLSSLNLQGNVNLNRLECSGNLLTSLNLQGDLNLSYVECSHNNLLTIDLANLSGLRYLDCSFNHLGSLNIQNLTYIENVYCNNNQIESLNLWNLPNIYGLNCSNNRIRTLGLQNSLGVLNCSQNQLSSLILQDLSFLSSLYCDNNPISCLSFLPNNLSTLSMSNTNINCLPNYPPNCTTTLPLCTPTNTNGCLFSARIYGNIYQDLNGNCLMDTTDVLQENISIQVKNLSTQEVFVTNSTTNGFYEIGVASAATYEVKAIFQNNYWATCPPQTVILTQNSNQIQQDLFIQPIVQCAYMEVEHEILNLARPCNTALYKVSYFNSGTISSFGTLAHISLPVELSLQSITRPYSALGNNVFEVQLPDVAPLDRDTFSFLASVSCSASMNQMLCTEVEILPHIYCNTAALGWDGSDITLSGHCIGQDSIRFTLQNTGNAAMSVVRNFSLIKDGELLQNHNFQLAVGASDSITIIANPQSIYKMIAEETPNNPNNNTYETVLVWGCQGTSGIHWNFVNQVSLNNGAVNPHRLCTPVRTSFDPNDISAIPEGTQSAHFILNNTELSYKIRFQNTGNDTAFVVRIIDKLPEELDATTLKIGAASHPFTWRLAGNGSLEFLFQQILLPDSTTNEAKSHGFVSYKLKTKPNLSIGSTINNQALIYFDVNTPVVTNTYTHTIGLSEHLYLPTFEPLHKQATIQFFPNPSKENLTIELDDADDIYQLKVVDLVGEILVMQKITTKTILLNTEYLPTGTYFIHFSGKNSISIVKFMKM